ncbi:MAG: DDE-type integrase/transposase/recombinase, partial [Candidatus Eisenbacteria bacterium]|nr:DDE-type integrase/transposase/recombinase [Candidatus Eisenbacteria bacterium]
MAPKDTDSTAARWARLRFAIVGRLLAEPPRRGSLRAELQALSERDWTHPTTGESVRFSFATLERWYYRAKNALRDPIGALARQGRRDAGIQPSLSDPLRRALRAQYTEHPRWSYQLHHDNLVALAKDEPGLGPVPSYATVRRHMQATGLVKTRGGRRRRATKGIERAIRRLDRLEVRSYEATHVHGLWHLDFHPGSRRVLTPHGRWVRPHLFGVLDDRSRLCCHLQWYLDETAETLVHGLSQAIQKRALPRALMTDNGSAMEAGETRQGLEELGIVHETTLVQSPYQNGKQESFWARVEGRLMAMLENFDPLTLERLNEATQAWVEIESNKTLHEEIGVTPLHRYLQGPDVGRPSPSSLTLRQVFRLKEWRTQRTSDGTVRIEGGRFEVPSRFRQHKRVLVRYARWNLSHIDLVDPRSGAILSPLYPLDREANADGRRRRLEPLDEPPVRPALRPPATMAPLLRRLLREYAATG